MENQQIFLNKLETKILLPFYFNNVHLAKKADLNEIKFHDFFKKSINNTLSSLEKNFQSNEIFLKSSADNFVIDLAQNKNITIDLNKKINEINEFKFKFHPESCFAKHFNSVDFYGSFFNNKRTVEGAAALNVEYLGLDFISATQKVFLINLVNFFIRKQLMPLSFDNIIEMVREQQGKNFLNEIKKSYVDKFNQIDFHCLDFGTIKKAWADLVDQKVNGDLENQKEYIKNDLFDVFFSCILVVILILRNVNLELRHLLKSTYCFNDFTNQDNKKSPAEILSILYDIYKTEAAKIKDTRNLTEKYLDAISLKKTKYVTLVERQYSQNHLFISDIYLVITCDYKEWNHDFFKNAVFNKQDTYLDIKNNKLLLFSDMIIHPEKYAIDINTKNYAYYSDFNEMIVANLNDCQCEICWNDHILENNVNNFILFRKNIFLNSQHNDFLNKYNKDFYLGLQRNYLIGIVFLISRNNIKIYIEQYANFVTNMQFRNKSIEYRVILKDLQKIQFTQLHFTYGVKPLEEIIHLIDREIEFTSSLEKLIKKVRTEDEIGKLIAERNSIATGFIVALFVSLMWFVDTTFAVYQSTGSGNSPAPLIISEAMFHAFVGFTLFVLSVITIMLIFTMIRLYQRYRKEKSKGIRNFW